jgi:hypothetical protein
MPDAPTRRLSASGGITVSSEVDGMYRAQVERLVVEFASRCSREQIERSVQDSVARYLDARVTAFVPILVYRDARSLLSDRRETAVGPGGLDD